MDKFVRGDHTHLPVIFGLDHVAIGVEREAAYELMIARYPRCWGVCQQLSALDLSPPAYEAGFVLTVKAIVDALANRGLEPPDIGINPADYIRAIRDIRDGTLGGQYEHKLRVYQHEPRLIETLNGLIESGIDSDTNKLVNSDADAGSFNSGITDAYTILSLAMQNSINSGPWS